MDDARPDLFHRHALELVRTMRQPATVQTRKRATSQLFGTLCRHVDKKKSTRDRRRALRFGSRRVLSLQIFVSHGHWRVLETRGKRHWLAAAVGSPLQSVATLEGS